MGCRVHSDRCCTERRHELAAPCFINEGSTSVHVPDVKGYQFGCSNVRHFTCDAGTFVDGEKDGEKQFKQSTTLVPGRNQRCVACVRKHWSACEVKTIWDQSCG